MSAALLVGFVLAVAALDRWLNPEFTAASLMATGVVLALVPAAVWLTFFYRRDRLEPEPVGMVLEVFLLGALLAGAVGIPLVDRVFAVHTWLYRSPWSHLLGAVLVVGFTQEFLKYAAVRFSVYDTSDFDELVDGIVYASAAGIGYATALNIGFVVESGGVDLGLGAFRIVLTVLAHSAIAGITGYHLGAEKLQHRPGWWMPVGVGLASFVNGVFFYTRGTVARGGLSAAGGAAEPWSGLVLSVVLIAAVTAVLIRVIDRDLAAALAEGEP